MATAVEKLRPSKLNPENQLMKDDTSVDEMTFFIKGKLKSSNIAAVMTAGSVERTMSGASTVVISVNDADRTMQTGDLLTNETDVNIDGLFFRLSKVERSGDSLDITFEDREVALLRKQNGFRKANRDVMTRAQFAESLVREQKQERIRFFSPEKKITQTVAPDPSTTDAQRGAGFAPGANVTVKGINATPAQLNNISIVISVGQAMNVGDIILLAAIETITVESSATNLSGGDRDSVGIFQQRNIAPWNKRDRHDVGQAATTFFEQALSWVQSHHIRRETISTAAEIAQGVQVSAFPDRYALWVTEAQNTLAQYTGGSSTSGDTNPFSSTTAGQGEYEFTRGTIDDLGRVTKENTWDCLNRLAQEVNWACFMVNGTVYFISEDYLFHSRPRMTIDADEQGIDQVDFDHDTNKKNSTLTITCHISRWGAPPGSVVLLKDHGIVDGRWLVQDITRSLFDDVATIQCIKPLPELPEPPASSSTGTPDSLLVGPTSSQRQAIVQAAQRVLSKASEYTYRQYRPMAQSIFDQFAKTHTDCSAFVTLIYKAAGAQDPNGFSYNGSGNTTTLWARGTLISEQEAQPGDLVFYGSRSGHRSSAPYTRHVAIFIGNGKTIEFGSTHPNEGTVHEASDFLGIRSYLD